MIDKYLETLQAELTKRGADPALIQDALFDAQEYLKEEVDEDRFTRTVAVGTEDVRP